MSTARDRLTAITVRNLTAKGFYPDGGGLYLQVSSYGTKSWVLRYTIEKKTRDMGLGSIADWTLAEARERARTFRQLTDQKIDPIAHRDAELAKTKTEALEAARNRRTFEECAKEYHGDNAANWKNVKHAAQWINTLTTYAFPHFGTVPVSQLSRDQIREALLPIWKTKAETASRVMQRIRIVVNYAASMGYCDGLDSEQWEQLKISLPNNSKQLAGEHHASCPHHQVSPVMRMISQCSSSETVKAAFEFIVYTAARSGEVRSAVWEEIDSTNRLWVIPEERMKAARQHVVPLSDAAWAVLERIRQSRFTDMSPSGLIFPGVLNQPLSDMTFTQLMRRLKVWYTMHGFRASFRTWGAEIAHYESDLLETALAHIVGDKTMRAYQRSDMVEKRRMLMQDWSNYIATTAGNTLDIAVAAVN